MIELKSSVYPLPEDVERLVASGCFTLAKEAIKGYLSKPIPSALRKRLEMEEYNMGRLEKDFPYTVEESDNMLSRSYPAMYRKNSISSELLCGNLAWIFIDGKMMVEKRVVDDAAKRIPRIKENNVTKADLKLRDDNIAYMLAKGERKARIKVRSGIKPLSGFGEEAWVNIPVVRASDCISDIKFSLASAGYQGVDSPSSQMRTAQFKKVLEEGDEFFIEYEYTITAHHRDIKDTAERSTYTNLSEYLKEELPHIQFTPYIKALVKEITANVHSPAAKARAIYDWVTTNVRYSFMREYKTIKNIPEYAAANLKGDCGVQAMLFITLCRIAGIPARWESGWYVTPSGPSCHDWAEFYLDGYGWCFADCSFGGGAYRAGNIERWNYYFGSSDVFRMPANSACCRVLTGKNEYASDPTDNQRGEIEIKSRGLEREELEWSSKVISFEFIGEGK